MYNIRFVCMCVYTCIYDVCVCIDIMYVQCIHCVVLCMAILVPFIVLFGCTYIYIHVYERGREREGKHPHNIVEPREAPVCVCLCVAGATVRAAMLCGRGVWGWYRTTIILGMIMYYCLYIHCIHIICLYIVCVFVCLHTHREFTVYKMQYNACTCICTYAHWNIPWSIYMYNEYWHGRQTINTHLQIV